MARNVGETIFGIGQSLQQSGQLKRQQAQQELVNQIALQKLQAEQAGTQRELQTEEARQLRLAPFLSGEKTLDPSFALDPIDQKAVKVTPNTTVLFGDQGGTGFGNRTLGDEQQSQSRFPPGSTVDPATGDVFDVNGFKIGNVGGANG